MVSLFDQAIMRDLRLAEHGGDIMGTRGLNAARAILGRRRLRASA